MKLPKIGRETILNIYTALVTVWSLVIILTPLYPNSLGLPSMNTTEYFKVVIMLSMVILLMVVWRIENIWLQLAFLCFAGLILHKIDVIPRHTFYFGVGAMFILIYFKGGLDLYRWWCKRTIHKQNHISRTTASNSLLWKRIGYCPKCHTGRMSLTVPHSITTKLTTYHRVRGLKCQRCNFEIIDNLDWKRMTKKAHRIRKKNKKPLLRRIFHA